MDGTGVGSTNQDGIHNQNLLPVAKVLGMWDSVI